MFLNILKITLIVIFALVILCGLIGIVCGLILSGRISREEEKLMQENYNKQFERGQHEQEYNNETKRL